MGSGAGGWGWFEEIGDSGGSFWKVPRQHPVVLTPTSRGRRMMEWMGALRL